MINSQVMPEDKLTIRFPSVPQLETVRRYQGLINTQYPPRPSLSRNPQSDLEQDLAALDQVIRWNVQQFIQETGEIEVRLLFRAYPQETLGCVMDDLVLYYQLAKPREGSTPRFGWDVTQDTR